MIRWLRRATGTPPDTEQPPQNRPHPDNTGGPDPVAEAAELRNEVRNVVARADTLADRLLDGITPQRPRNGATRHA